MRRKLDKLKQLLESETDEADFLAIAFSGGVDSTLLLDVAHEVLGCRVVALTISSAVYPETEENFTRAFCREKSIKHAVVNCDIFKIDGFGENTKDRCYFCKKALFASLRDEAQKICESLIAQRNEENGFHATNVTKGAHAKNIANGETKENGAHKTKLSCIPHETSEHHNPKIILADGSNATDEQDIRPGAHALRELGVISPLCMARLTKQEVRDLSRERALPTWNKPSMACLASRVAFGDEITPEILHNVEVAENMLQAHGFEQVRVRVHEAGRMARLEVLPHEISRLMDVMQSHDGSAANDISHKFHELGFAHVAIDIDGYRTGSMNVEGAQS